MSTEYKPGQVAIATVRGQGGVRIFRTEGSVWATPTLVDNNRWHDEYTDLVDVRPLVVLDLDEMALRGGWDSAAKLIDSLKRHGYATLATELVEQTKSPNIPEPEWASVVEAHTSGRTERRRFVGIGDSLWLAKHHNHHAPTYKWSDLINPTLVREGVES